jgi:CubicO group peptidase (beta-lactamase class C family)
VNGPAFGGLVGTAGGFGKFQEDQLRDRSVLLNESARRLLYDQQRTTRGELIPMTLGWHIGTLNGMRYFYKEGGGGGFHSMMRLYPGARVGTVVMANATGLNVERLLDRIDPSFLGPDAVRQRVLP